ncbi:MAG: 4'-phosphopantetheinyl transferase superfamily protein [Methanobrevibacter sp.]|jgi:4'-phosphopantetheinyl transferase|nr:4'-phosphopantetheinyl transferase superfamily protein [Candidatus Methanovirga meridionalis]
MFLNYLNVTSIDMNTMKNYLSEDYLKTLDRKYLFDKDKCLSGGGRILLKFILSKIGIEDYIINIDDRGKPFLDNYPNISFNISHSGELVMVGVCDEDIGVDIEKIQNLDYSGLSNHFFHLNEYKEIVNSENPINTFFRIWTLKESYVKMKGTGIVDLKSFIVNIKKKIIDKQELIDIYIEENKTKDNLIKNISKGTVNNNNNVVFKINKDLKLKTWGLNNQYFISVCSKKEINTKPKEILLSDIDNQLL